MPGGPTTQKWRINMKNVFKKNQIIISALAIMIAVAGYLNFTKEKANDVDAKLTAALDNNLATDASKQGNEEDPLSTAVQKENEYADISDEDELLAQGAGDDLKITVGDNGELLWPNNSTQTADGKDADKDSGTLSASGEPGSESGDPSKETSTPGEAVLASTTLGNGFFSNAKLTREQNRAKQKEILMDLIADESISEAQKQSAIDEVIAMTANAEKENAAELLLEAKGFEGAVVNMVEDSVDVVVNSAQITEQQIAQIEDIVMRKTGAKAEDIVITNVIMEE